MKNAPRFWRPKCDLIEAVHINVNIHYNLQYQCYTTNNIPSFLDIYVFPEPYHKEANTLKSALRGKAMGSLKSKA